MSIYYAGKNDFIVLWGDFAQKYFGEDLKEEFRNE